MIHLNRQYFDEKCSEMLTDIENKRMTSSSWIWAAAGAAAGLVLSCVRFKHNETKPFLAAYDKKGASSGKPNSKWNSKNNKRFRDKEDK